MSVQRLHVEPGQEFDDGFTDGLRWLVAEIDDAEVVWLTAFMDGEPTGAIMNWPRNRWHALLDKQRLTPVEDVDA